MPTPTKRNHFGLITVRISNCWQKKGAIGRTFQGSTIGCLPKIIVFCDLVGVGIDPLSKIFALEIRKFLNQNPYYRAQKITVQGTLDVLHTT